MDEAGLKKINIIGSITSILFSSLISVSIFLFVSALLQIGAGIKNLDLIIVAGIPSIIIFTLMLIPSIFLFKRKKWAYISWLVILGIIILQAMSFGIFFAVGIVKLFFLIGFILVLIIGYNCIIQLKALKKE